VIIYLVRNRVNGKCYIGKTCRTLSARWREHVSEARQGRYETPLYQDMRLYQLHCFEVEELAHTANESDLANAERRFIRIFNSVDNGYNVDGFSHGGNYRAHRTTFARKSAEHKARIATSQRAAWAARKAA
jgi:group I intron endonuclease